MKKFLIVMLSVGILMLFAQVGIASLPDSTESASTSEWTMFGRTMNNTFYYPGYVPANISGLVVRNFTTSNSILQQTALTVSDGAVFATDWTYVHKLNVSNFSQELSRSGSISPMGTPVIWNGSVYVGSSSSMKQLNASNLSQTIATKTGIVGYIYHAPVVSNGYLYFGGFNDGIIYQVNASNITQTMFTYSEGARCYGGPSVVNGYLYIGCGATLWQMNATNVSGRIATLSIGSGSINYAMVPVVANGYVYFGADNGRLYQTNATNVTRHVANISTGYEISGPPAFANNAVYFGNINGTVYQVNASNVTVQLSNVTLPGAIYSSLLVTDSYVFVASGSRVYQLNASNVSSIITSIPVGANLNGITIADGIFYTGDSSRFHQLLSVVPVATQNNPANNYSSTNGSRLIDFSCTATSSLGLANVSLYITNNQSAGFALNSTTSISGLVNTTNWTIRLGGGNYSWNCLVYDSANTGSWGSNRSISINFTDSDGDGTADSDDRLRGNESYVNTTGISNLNITVGGNSTNGTFLGVEQVVFYDGASRILNFTHNFTLSELALDRISIIKGENYILVNASRQVQAGYNKTIYLSDNSFVSLCAKDQEISSISNISSTCTDTNEIDLTSCIGNSTVGSYGNITCVDEGSVIAVGNLQHSGVVGTVASVVTTENDDEEEPSAGQGSSYIKEIPNYGSDLRFDLRLSKGFSAAAAVKNSMNTGVKELEVKAKDWLTGQVRIKSQTEKPDNCDIQYGGNYKLYKAIEIDHTFSDSQVSNARLRVGVDKAWIAENNIHEIVAVRCYPYYQELISSYVDEDSLEGLYDVYSSGFSTWAVLGTVNPVEIVSQSPAQIKNFPWVAIIVAGTVLAFIIVIGVLYRRKAMVREGMHLHTKLFDLDWSFKIKFNTPPHERRFFRPK